MHEVRCLIPRVHELVARAMRGKCVRRRIKQKSAVLPLSTVSSIPRVRTYHTRKSSRFVHALSARPLKVQGGRESSTRADESKDFCQPSPVGEGGARSVAEKYAEKRQNVLIPFTKCTIHDKIKDNRASGAKMMGGERQRQRRGTRLACARRRRERKAGFPVILRKTFLYYI